MQNRIFAVLLFAAALITGACGSSLTGPEKALVGTWVFAGAAFGNYEFYDNIPRLEIRFNADGTTEDDQGGMGTWKIENNQLFLDGESGTYYLDGDDLTLIISKTEFLEYADFTEEDYRIFNELLEPDDTVRMFFKRKS